MSLYVLKPKTENKNITQDYMIGTRKDVKAVYKLKKSNQKSKSNSLHFFSREFIVSASFSIFTNVLFAFIHYTFCFSSISMGFC